MDTGRVYSASIWTRSECVLWLCAPMALHRKRSISWLSRAFLWLNFRVVTWGDTMMMSSSMPSPVGCLWEDLHENASTGFDRGSSTLQPSCLPGCGHNSHEELGGFPSKPLNRREGERSNTFAGVRQRGRDWTLSTREPGNILIFLFFLGPVQSGKVRWRVECRWLVLVEKCSSAQDR